jgi:hypothetical protein
MTYCYYQLGVIVLIGGWVEVIGATEDGGQALLALRSSGDLVGEQAALENQPRSVSVISADASLDPKSGRATSCGCSEPISAGL